MNRDQVERDVRTCIANAREATADGNIEGIVEWLFKAVSLYEEHPSTVHAPRSEIEELVLCIHITTTLCETYEECEEEALELETRAEALCKPLH